MQEIVIGTGLNVSGTGRKHSDGDGPAESERTAYRNSPGARSHGVGVAPRSRCHIGPWINLQHRDIRARIAADKASRLGFLVGKHNVNFGGVGHDMIVGDDVTLRTDHEPRAQRLSDLRLAGARAATVERVEEIVERPLLDEGDVLLPLASCKWSVVPPWRCPSVTVAHLGLAGLADAATRVFDFRNRSQEPLHKKPA